MSQQKKLEKVLDLLVNEDTGRATELLHQIIVEKARTIYESIVNEEDDEEEDDIGDDTVGGDSDEDFTDEISSDKDEIDADELNDGEAGDDEEDGEDFGGDDFGGDEGGDGERIDDLEDQLAQLRAEFDALMSQEVEEPEHADLDIGAADDFGGADDDFGGEFDDEIVNASMYESKTKRKEVEDKFEKFTKGNKDKKAQDKHKGKAKVDEETQFTSGVADTGQKGKAGLVGTGKNTPLGAEQDRAIFTKAPSKPSYGGEPVDFTKGKGGEYGQYHGDHATDDTISDNVDEKEKHVGKADMKDDWTGTGKESGSFGTQQKRSPFTKKPS